MSHWPPDQWTPENGDLVYLRLRVGEKEPVFLIGKALWKKNIPSATSKLQVGLDLTPSPETGLKCFREYVRELLARR